MPPTANRGVRQAAVTVATGHRAEKLDSTFLTFAQNPFLELHAFVIGEHLPTRQLPQITYHLFPHDPAYSHEMREIYYRRLLFLDTLDVEYAVLVDNGDVLCMQPLPQLPDLLRGAAFGGVAEHGGGKYIEGQGYTSSYLNAGVTFWNIPKSKQLRLDIEKRGRTRFRSIEDQLTLNEVLHTKYYDDMVLLGSQYNYRPCLAPTKIRNWPTVDHLDGVKIYHNVHCVQAAKNLIPVKALASLPDLEPDSGPLTPRQQFWRSVQHRLFLKHHV